MYYASTLSTLEETPSSTAFSGQSFIWIPRNFPPAQAVLENTWPFQRSADFIHATLAQY
jgi:hypothetical protein